MINKIEIKILWKKTGEKIETVNKYEYWHQVREYVAKKMKEKSEHVYLYIGDDTNFYEIKYDNRIDGHKSVYCLRGLNKYPTESDEQYENQKENLTVCRNEDDSEKYFLWLIPEVKQKVPWKAFDLFERNIFEHENIEVPLEVHRRNDGWLCLRTKYYRLPFNEYLIRSIDVIEWKFICKDIVSGLLELEGWFSNYDIIVNSDRRCCIVPLFWIYDEESGEISYKPFTGKVLIDILFTKLKELFPDDISSKFNDSHKIDYLKNHFKRDEMVNFIEQLGKNDVNKIINNKFIKVDVNISLKTVFNENIQYTIQDKYTPRGFYVEPLKKKIANFEGIESFCLRQILVLHNHEVIYDYISNFEEHLNLEYLVVPMKGDGANNSFDFDRIGVGGFSEVFCSSDRKSAVKRFYYKKNKATNSFVKEVITFRKLKDHPNIVRLKDYYIDELRYKRYCILMEYMDGGSLLSILPPNGFDTLKVLEYAVQIVNGLAYMHSLEMLHFDLKCDNILLTNDQNRVVLADFNFSKPCSKSGKIKDFDVSTYYIMAPEVLKCDNYGLSADMWSLGVTLIEMATGKIDSKFKKCRVLNLADELENKQKQIVDEDLFDLISRCKVLEPDKRIESVEMLIKLHSNTKLPNNIIDLSWMQT